MKKLYTILMLICFALSAYAETVFTFSTAADINQTKDGISVVLAKANGNNAPYYDAYAPNGAEIRVYVNNTITITGEGLQNIQMVFARPDGKKYTTLTASTGVLASGGTSTGRDNPVLDTWTGDASSVVFTLGDAGQRIVKKIVINGAPINPDDEEQDEPAPLPTAEDLVSPYEYAEPTAISVPDTTIAKKEYAFIDNNILVHCNQGSIVAATDSTHAYFNCNAGYSLTFTATKPIKGISVDGFVRKAFNATCDKGEIQYLTDEDKDVEGWPVLVITDIDATSVTLNCPKQLRCYGVRVFFEGNPNPIEEGIDTIESAIKAQKVLQNGQLYIIRNGRTYTAEGAVVK